LTVGRTVRNVVLSGVNHLPDDCVIMSTDKLVTRAELLAAGGRRQQLAAMPTSVQIRAARGLPGWSQAELAARAGLSGRTVERAERREGTPRVTVRTLEAITRALEAGGIEFFRNANGLGVRLRRRQWCKSYAWYLVRTAALQIPTKSPADSEIMSPGDTR
jgi:transcriptional regulator with XRE-family HTH domain